ncbi:MAG: 2-phosphosulfolactate phosphatase [Alphaproteobacteria bacterium PA2]|nr:MAG: 2-phosphosulfolactate phosphatase [Alphaproteobacteria bacterium PA2]
MARIVCEWGLAGIEAWASQASAFVIVDVLSFSTAVSIAVDRGASIIPFPFDDSEAAAEEADRRGAQLATPKRAMGGQFSLSPASLRSLEPGSLLVLPSPNGSRLSLATGCVPTATACLRNFEIVAAWAKIVAGDGVIAVIAAGERWPDNSLRPAIEDWLGAGSVISALAGEENSEATSARRLFEISRNDLPRLISQCVSGRELFDRGFGQDVEIALEIGAGNSAAILENGAYGAWSQCDGRV